MKFTRTAEPTPETLCALSACVESLRDIAALPAWCLVVPLQDEADVRQRMAALFTLIDLTSQHHLDRECNAAKRALRAFAAALEQLDSRERAE